ncbi:hypothetical protein KC330_g7557 [Hortaea werneckii]|nr:hypothetical protein KC330_g7557 [Hortaea werneckii]
MAAAEAIVTRGDESDPSDDSDESADDDSDAECASNRRSAPPPSRQTLTELQSACLSFCIELLNQQIHNHEYDMVIICALAVLWVLPTGKGFRYPNKYPSILSAIIKVAHFLLVQQADQLGRWDDQEYSSCGSAYDFEDSGYESGGSRDRPQRFEIHSR